jgi:hypothetical protein
LLIAGVAHRSAFFEPRNHVKESAMARESASTRDSKASIDPATHKLTERQAQRLASVSGVDAGKLVGRTVTEIGESFRFQIDPMLLFFRRICGKVVKTDPATGIQYPVPYATVHVEDTDCSLLGYFPSGSPWSWYFPFSCHREVIATTRTDACGEFCVWVPRWHIDWILRWRAERVCFPIIFERPNLRELIEDLMPLPFPPEPVPGPDPAPIDPLPLSLFDRGPALSRLSDALGAPAVKQLLTLEASAGFGASTVALQQMLGAAGHASELAPPLPEELKLALGSAAGNTKAGANAAVLNLAARLRLNATELRGLDLRRYVGPFKRCFTRFVPQWTPLIDVPDITFRVTQDTNGDGVEEQVYGESYFQVRWNAGNISPVIIEAGPQARAGVLCGPAGIPCGNTPAIVLAGRLPVANEPTLYDPVQGYALRTNRPHPTQFFNDPLPNPDAASPFASVVSLYGCNKTDPAATKYRIVHEYSSDNGASYSAKTPFVGLTWPLFRLDGGGNAEWHYPMADALGWYPIALPAGPNPFIPQDLLLDWPTYNFANGRYRLTLELGTGGNTATSASAPVVFNVDNSAPSGVFNVEWSFNSTGPWQPLGGVCPTVRRGVAPADVYFRVTLAATATHLRAVQMWPSSCGAGTFGFISGTGGVQPSAGSLVYEHWHTAVSDNNQTLQVIYQLPNSALEGTYGFGGYVSSRAFNPSGGDGGHLQTPAWQYDPAPIAIWPSVAFSVINSA